MKISGFILLLILGHLSSLAQIERKPVVLKADSTQTAVADVTDKKQSRKDRFKELDLTREQKIKMKGIMQENKTAKDAVENNAQLSDQDKKKQLRALQKAQLQKIQAILTPEQRQKFKASKPTSP